MLRKTITSLTAVLFLTLSFGTFAAANQGDPICPRDTATDCYTCCNDTLKLNEKPLTCAQNGDAQYQCSVQMIDLNKPK